MHHIWLCSVLLYVILDTIAFLHLQDSSVAVQIYHVIAFFVLHDIMLNHD